MYGRGTADGRRFLGQAFPLRAPENIVELVNQVKEIAVPVAGMDREESYLVHPSGVAARVDLIGQQAKLSQVDARTLLAYASVTEGRIGNYAIRTRVALYKARIKRAKEIDGVTYGIVTRMNPTPEKD